MRNICENLPPTTVDVSMNRYIRMNKKALSDKKVNVGIGRASLEAIVSHMKKVFF